MSSATSIKGARLAQPAPGGDSPGEARGAANDAFRPWHFFVLLSLVAATVAVAMTQQATPEQLILLSFTIGAAGVAAAALYRTLAPLAAQDVSVFREPLTERSRATLAREKMLVLRSIKELEFDRAMGKLSPKDFEEMAGRLRGRAVALMKQLDEGGTPYRDLVERELAARLASDVARAPVAPDEDGRTAAETRCTCGTANDADASFCKRCGTRL